ncbi:hypothetical protein TNCV_3969021 [Trichonephila clavipes]|nr:hypothetical protein TNCV_3969021 [Trichonephila clavipes]
MFCDDTSFDITFLMLNDSSANVWANYTLEKANIRLQGLTLIPQSSRNASVKDMEVCAAIQRDACSDHQVCTAVMVDFSETGGKIPTNVKTSNSHTAHLSLSEEPNSSVLLLPSAGATSTISSVGQELSSPAS